MTSNSVIEEVAFDQLPEVGTGNRGLILPPETADERIALVQAHFLQKNSINVSYKKTCATLAIPNQPPIAVVLAVMDPEGRKQLRDKDHIHSDDRDDFLDSAITEVAGCIAVNRFDMFQESDKSSDSRSTVQIVDDMTRGTSDGGYSNVTIEGVYHSVKRRFEEQFASRQTGKRPPSGHGVA